MRWDSLQHYSARKFRRFSGVKRKVFDLMVNALREQKAARRKSAGGRKPLLDNEDQLLLLLYYREYNTMFHLGTSFGLSESRVYTLIAQTEALLLKDKRFHLGGRRYCFTASRLRAKVRSR